MTLIWYEWKKLWRYRSLIFILLALLLLDIWKIYDTRQTSSYFVDSPEWEMAYWELYEEFKGEITESKAQSLVDLYQPIADSVKDLTFNTATDKNSLTGINRFSDSLFLSRFYVTPMKRFYNYENTATEIATKAQNNVEFFRSLGNTYEMQKNARIYFLFKERKIESFEYFESYSRLVDHDFSSWLILVFCIYGLNYLISREKESEMATLISTTFNGRNRTLIAKIVVCIFFIIFVVLSFSLTDWVAFLSIYHSTEGSSLPIYALLEFSESPLTLTLWQYMILSICSKCIGMFSIGIACLLIAYRTRKSLISLLLGLLCSCGFLFLATVCRLSDYGILKVLNPGSWLIPRTLFRDCSFCNIAGYPFLLWEAALIVATAFCLFFTLSLFRRNQV